MPLFKTQSKRARIPFLARYSLRVTAEVVAMTIILHTEGERKKGKKKTSVSEQFMWIVCQVVMRIPPGTFSTAEQTTSNEMEFTPLSCFTVQIQASNGLKWGPIRHRAHGIRKKKLHEKFKFWKWVEKICRCRNRRERTHKNCQQWKKVSHGSNTTTHKQNML